MDTSSEYTFPIFISSTDYNLKDLRAELARFLSELGYRPILSSAEGFPDNSPILEPWESCIPVLDKSFVMVLIIDGDYSQALKWPNFTEHFGERKISPTHGEYIYAHKLKKRMLVFIRKSLMPHYQSYRQTMEHFNNDRSKAREALSITLPKNVSFETLEFIGEVKTTRPIPWINEFDDITSVKKEIQKKMLNELAEIFLIKNRHAETVVDAFNKVLDSLSSEEQKKALSKINATKEIIDAVESFHKLENELSETKKKAEESENLSSTEKNKLQKKVKELQRDISQLERNTMNSSDSYFFLKDGQVKVGNPNYNIDDISIGSLYSSPNKYLTQDLLFTQEKCDQCSRIVTKSSVGAANLVLGDTLRECPECLRKLCVTCWPPLLSSYIGSCVRCSSLSNIRIPKVEPIKP